MMRTGGKWRVLLLVLALVAAPAAPMLAQESSTSISSTTGSVTLSSQGCSLSIASGELNFGVWTWQAENNRYWAGSDEVRDELHLIISGGGPDGCDVTIASDGFWLDGSDRTGPPAIGPKYLAVWMQPGGNGDWTWMYLGESGSVNVPGLKGFPGEPNEPTSVNIGLMGAPNTIQPGIYTGQFTITITDRDSTP